MRGLVGGTGEAVGAFAVAIDSKALLKSWAWLLPRVSGGLTILVSIGWLGT